MVDVQLGRMMDEAELEAHANTWLPSDPPSDDMDAQLRYLLVMLTSGSALKIMRQQPSVVQAFRDRARQYNPRSQARSSHSCKRSCSSILDMIRQASQIVWLCSGDSSEGTRPQAESSWVYKSKAPYIWSEFRRNSERTCCSPVIHDHITPL